ncbi:uncharacterized protein DUF4185 [Arcticibacter tournemirensis]|uniref:DUF4185 domain-containing protein n=1 Tax=Arcticibacter tournemirensis TaxID=699437 RepID=A0A5M9GZ92_9SPHI|nr:DUF4185 domain-containing protein [Arcticibacter tournemirensis]KAA8479091.1 DUF4185 domain-containing protein [Arcticibacter tournemirensis]TQM48656.1 uncharacterized protein DUF4185 [Arcticibacter tournemirensis]
MRRLIAIAIVLSFSGELFAQKKDLNYLKYSVEEAPEWSALFKRSSGWFGGDGIYTIPLNAPENRFAGAAGKTLFLFSDSMIGTIIGDSLQDGSRMIHNSVAVLNGNKPLPENMEFHWKKNEKGEAETLFEPLTPSTQKDDYYWLGDGFVNPQLNNALYIFGYRIHNVSEGAFGFREVGNTLIKIPAGSKPPFSDYQQMDTPFFLKDEDGDIGSFGAGIFVNTKDSGAPSPDGYVYIYGVRGKAKNLLVARVKPEDFERFKRWRFWDGKSWNANINKAAVLTNAVSNELSVSPLPDGRYALVFQVNGIGTTVGLRLGSSPVGPFGPIIKIWDSSKDAEEKTYIMYNAKVHPSLSAPGELLISYNVNSVDFLRDLKKNPYLYRPRFIRVKLL